MTTYLFYLFVYGCDVVLLSNLDILRQQLHCISKTARLIQSVIIAATCTGSKTRLAAKCTVSNMMGPKQSIIYFDGMKAKLANGYWNTLVNNCFVIMIFKKMCNMIKRKTKYEKVMVTVGVNEKKSLRQHPNHCPV